SQAFGTGARPGSVRAYAIAVACVLIAAGIRGLLGTLGSEIVPYATFYPAVLFATLLGGMRAGIVAAILSALVGWWAFVNPAWPLITVTLGHAISIMLFLAACGFIIWGGGTYRRMVERLYEEEHQRDLVVAELRHR